MRLIQCLAIKAEASDKVSEGDWESALVKYRTGLELLKNESDADPTVCQVRVALLSNLSLCHLKTQEFDVAVQVATEALSINPRFPKALYRRALALVELGELTKAADDVSQLISLKEVDQMVIKLLDRINTLAKEKSERAKNDDLVDAFQVIKRFAVQDDGDQDARSLKLAIEVLIAHLIKYGRPESLLREPLFELSVKLLKKISFTEIAQLEAASQMLRLLELLLLDSTSENQSAMESTTNVDIDVSVSTACATRREKLKALFPVQDFVPVFSSLISAGVSDEGDTAKRARFGVVSGVVGLTQMIGSLDGREWLKILSEGLACVECLALRERTLTAFAKLCLARRVAGLRAKAFLMTHELQCCLEALADLIEIFHLPQDDLLFNKQETDTPHTHETHTQSDTERKINLSKQIDFAFATAFTLLADKERKVEEEVNWSNLLQSLAGSRLSGSSQTDTATGLSILNIAWLANKQEVFAFSLLNSIPIVALSHALEVSLEDGRLQKISAEYLLNCLEFVELRQLIIDADCVDLIATLTQTTADLELRGLLAAVLARMCLHGDAEREVIFDKVDFFRLTESIVIKLADHLAHQQSQSSENTRQSRLILRVMQVLFFLSLHADFKREMLGLSPDLLKQMESDLHTEIPKGAAALPDQCRPALQRLLRAISPSPILECLPRLGRACLSAQMSEGCFLFVALINNLVRSRDEKDRLKKNKNAPDFDEEQMQQLQMIFDKLPEKARPQKQSHFDQGSTLLCQAIRSRLLETNAVVSLVKEIVSANNLVTSHLLKLASTTVRSFAFDGLTRTQLYRQGGVGILLKTIQAFKNLPDEIRDFRQTLARIAMSIPPSALRYDEIMGCASQLIPLLSDESELMSYEACLALTNFMAVSEEVRVHIWNKGKGWWQLEDLASSDNAMLRAGGLECLCNMAESEKVLDEMSVLCRQRKMAWQPNLLLAFISDLENRRAVLAALGCLASISLSVDVSARLVERVKGDIGHLLQTADFSISTADAPMQIRVAHCLVNLWDALHEAVLDDQLRDGDIHKEAGEGDTETKEGQESISVGAGLDLETLVKSQQMLFLGLPVLHSRMSDECQRLINDRVKLPMKISPVASVYERARDNKLLDSRHTEFWVTRLQQ